MTHNYIDGAWSDGNGDEIVSVDPSTGQSCFAVKSATPTEVSAAVAAAKIAFPNWATTSLEQRVEILQRYREIILRDAEKLARIISIETGKPFWETKTEAAAVAGKVDISIKAYAERTGIKSSEVGGGHAVLRHKPHGVLAVLGPFNFPAHLPNGHIVPALIAGNTIVFKPSELAPGPGAFLIKAMEEAGVPKGVVNLVHGAREAGQALASHGDIDGLLFTGGARTGAALHRLFADKPEKILALELGGNNPLIWWDTKNNDAAAFAALQSAFSTSGQRCTCARRLIVPAGAEGDRALEMLVGLTDRIVFDAPFSDPQPFMGPLISAHAAKGLVEAFKVRETQGGKVLKELSLRDEGGAFVSPGIIDLTNAKNIPDEEHFGPMLQVYRASSFDEAIDRANETAFGLSAGLLSDDPEKWNRFLALSKAGIVNWNRQTTGASSGAPFGGIGHSGNHRPSAYYAADYCAYPVASMEGASLISMPENQVGLK